jgi:hypothetical protein
MKLAIRIETILTIALLVVASDQGNFLLRKSLSMPLPIPKTKEYIKQMTTVSTKFPGVFSSVKAKKKNTDVANEIQHKVIKFLRFMIDFLNSKLTVIITITNYFSLIRQFTPLNGTKKNLP